MSRVNSEKDTGEFELSAIGIPKNAEASAINALETHGANEEARRTALAEQKIDFFHEDGTVNLDSLILGEVEAVNYIQYYLEPTIENMKLVLSVVKSRGLNGKDDSVETEASTLFSIFEGNDTELQQRTVSAIQQIRLFDARNKKVEYDLSGKKDCPITIDIKWKPEGQDANRTALKWRAVDKGNGNKKVTEAIDEIIEIAKEREIGVGKVDRIFIAYEYLPAAILDSLGIFAKIQGTSDEVRDKVIKLVIDEFSEKRDVRLDEVEGPNGKIGFMVTREAELELPKGKTKDNDMLAERDKRAAETTDSYIREGYVPYVAGDFDAGTVALANDPAEAIKEFLSDKREDKDAVEIEMRAMEEKVKALRKVVGVEPDRQIWVSGKHFIKTEADGSTKADKSGNIERLNTVGRTREDVMKEIDAILHPKN